MKFDYVLIGGGTSACVLASQLLKRKLGSVAIVESGGTPRGPRTFTPVRYTDTFASRWDFGLRTEPQRELANRRIAWPRGRMLGGSSGINAMIYMPPNRGDLELWPENWSYDNVLPSIKEIENTLFGVNEIKPEIHPLSQLFLSAVDEYKRSSEDHNFISSVRYRQTQRQGRRHTSYSAFLKPLLERPELTILENAHASRILFDDDRATEVEFHQTGESYIVTANVAVVLTAGTIASPLLLMQSGIGPHDLLIENLIDKRIDLDGVGRNLQDHLVVPLIFESSNQTSLEKYFSKEARLAYLRDRTGPKTSNLAEVGAFLRVGEHAGFGNDFSRRQTVQLHFTPTHYLEYPTRTSPVHAWTIGVTQSNPLSRGEIRITSGKNTKYQFTIDPQYLNQPGDLETLIESIQKVLPIASQPSLAKARGAMLIPKHPFGTETSEDLDTIHIEKLVRRYAMTLYHPVGTCSIGDHRRAVVDKNLRVHGTNNLYVADASIIPNIPTGNPQAFAMLIGFQLASLIAS